ncbi:hypothetical protein M422DRAFT_262840 [Sphaerobolus stellatus SS14]|uniref:Uncharacterized protein n=1 Tax=Sphaerobolus stellatus (strain SS14) TaxID=990650 RepID=A0A0C9VC19_SPHS4|nr:hypothetical protein M422DRAFT_262840 [Sphaerobolus stellatus SS14]
MVLHGDACTSLKILFNSLPSTLPLNPPNSLLPPQIDVIFADEEGAWPAFNKAMHAAFGDKVKGISITERGDGLAQTIAVIQWMLQELHEAGDAGFSELVKLWINTLVDAVKAAAGEISRVGPVCSAVQMCPKHAVKPTRQQELQESVTDANNKAKQVQTRTRLKEHYFYVNEHGIEVPEEGVVMEDHVLEAESDPAYLESGDETSGSETDGCKEVDLEEDAVRATLSSDGHHT